jgi:lipopolysaccharide transport system ATP-binding protein
MLRECTMSSLAIFAESLAKRYRIGAAVERPRTLTAAATATLAAPLRNLKRLRRLVAFDDIEEADAIWAVRDVSFEVKQGEVVGLIGRNGAGKSTLLKILSRITHPTTGRARVLGRVGSLLEVGTGFHPELTGRENVYLNGSILGMDRAYISRRFDEIVEFAGVGRFVDTPVKRYSSGMYLRLAFAVSAHLEPDILIVDEVLAVGDAEFQQKCLGRMDQTAHEGRTVLFVSHNLTAIRRLCARSVLMDGGVIVADGQTADVVSRYISGGRSQTAPGSWIDLSAAHRDGVGGARFVGIRYGSPIGAAELQPPCPGSPLELRATLHASKVLPRVSVGFNLRDNYGTTLVSGSTNARGSTAALPEGISTWRFRIASLWLQPGLYQLELWVGDQFDIHDHLDRAILLEVFESQASVSGPRFDPRSDGVLYCEYDVTRVEPDGEGSSAAYALADEAPGGRCGRGSSPVAV